MRKEYQLTPEETAELLAAMRPVPMILLQCGPPPSQQDNANRAWLALGQKRGFNAMTVLPSARGASFFTAEETNGDQSVTASPSARETETP